MFSTLIDAHRLASNAGNDDWAVVDCRFYLAEPERGEAEYLEEHVPGAVYAHLDRDLSAPLTGRNGRHPMPSVEHMQERFSRWGIDGNVQVVAYDTAGGQMAARLWWMLRYLGHDSVAVLDGGLDAWKAEGLSTATGRQERNARRFSAWPRPAMRVDVDSLQRGDALSEQLLLDARAPERFRGETEPLDPVAGHIPGARNLPSTSNLDEGGRFLPAGVLLKRFEAAIGTRPLASVVSYCGSGVTACHNLLAMEAAGLVGARLYPGSWSEWCADETRPVETGP